MEVVCNVVLHLCHPVCLKKEWTCNKAPEEQALQEREIRFHTFLVSCVVSFTLQAYIPETGSLLPTLQKAEWISEPVWVRLMKITVSKH